MKRCYISFICTTSISIFFTYLFYTSLNSSLILFKSFVNCSVQQWAHIYHFALIWYACYAILMLTYFEMRYSYRNSLQDYNMTLLWLYLSIIHLMIDRSMHWKMNIDTFPWHITSLAEPGVAPVAANINILTELWVAPNFLEAVPAVHSNSG